MAHRNVQRNLQILAERKAGMTLAALGRKYGVGTPISPEGIRKIVNKEKAREAFGPFAYLLSGRATRALRKFCEMRGRRIPQDLKQLRRILIKGWKADMKSIKGIGPKTVAEIEFVAKQEIEF